MRMGDGIEIQDFLECLDGNGLIITDLEEIEKTLKHYFNVKLNSEITRWSIVNEEE